MIFWELFYRFLKIGLFTFGGGYAMIALIQSEVTVNHQWLTQQEFTDILAISQMSPGPVGINTATYTGYTAIINAGYPTWAAVGGAILSSGAVIFLPVLLMIVAIVFLRRMRGNRYVESIFKVLRMAIVGLVAAAALQLLNTESFGQPCLNLQFVVSIVICMAVFILSLRRVSPIILILFSGLLGILVYAFQ